MMDNEKCCICGEEVIRVYTYLHTTDQGNKRMYLGHKGCLGVLGPLIKQGKAQGIPYSTLR